MNIYWKDNSLRQPTFAIGLIILLLLPIIVVESGINKQKQDSIYNSAISKCKYWEENSLSLWAKYDSESIEKLRATTDCESYAKNEAKRKVYTQLYIIFVLVIVAWYFVSIPLHDSAIIPLIESSKKRQKDARKKILEQNKIANTKEKKEAVERGYSFKFNSSYNNFKNYKENPTPEMFTDITVATDVYIKKYPDFTSTISEQMLIDYINWAIEETENIFKDNPIKSKIQKENLIKLLNKLNKRITKTNE